nr:beta-lactamase family protein [Cytophagales bacterium]
MRKTFFWLPLLIFIGTTVSAQIANPATGGNAKLEQRIKAVENNLIPYVPVQGFPGWNILERMKHYKVPGVSIAVIKDYKIDWAKAYGLADTIKKTPVTTETMFSAGSISKLVMAAAALRLVQEGKLSLDEPINNYLTSWKLKENEWTQEKPVTLRMLLSHTGGTSQSAYFGYTPDKNPLPTVVEILSGAPGSETNPVVVNSEPGKGFRYSGGGSLVAQ